MHTTLDLETVGDGGQCRTDDGQTIGAKNTWPCLFEKDRVRVLPSIHIINRECPGTVPEFLAFVIALDDESDIQAVIVWNTELISV